LSAVNLDSQDQKPLAQSRRGAKKGKTFFRIKSPKEPIIPEKK